MKDKKNEIIAEYDIHNMGMLDHLLEHHKNEPLYERYTTHVKSWFKWEIIYRWYDFKRYIKNLWLFKDFLRDWYPWDYESQLKLFAFGLEQLANRIDGGYEVKDSRDKKVAAIRELVTLLRTNYEDGIFDKYYLNKPHDDDYHVTEYADGSIGYENISPEEKQEADRERARQYEEELESEKIKYYERMFRLIRGQKKSETDKLYSEAVKQLPEDKREDWNELAKISHQIFDGTGIETWWE